MLTGYDIIVFSDDWGRHPFSCQHLMKEILPYNRILWVNTIGMRRPNLSLYDVKRSIQKIVSFCTKTQSHSLPENLTILNPFMLPFGNRVVQCLNRASVIKAVREVMIRKSYRRPLVLTTLPNATDYLGSFGEKVAVYYCVDDFTLWPGANISLVKEKERSLLGKIDLLLCSSQSLAEIKPTAAPVEILPHGVDYDHFSRASQGLKRALPVCVGLSGPVIGYFGLLGEWVDLDLLESILKESPEWTLLLVGNVISDISCLSSYPNLRLTGVVAYDELPDYVAYMDVCILPYVTHGRGQSITPLKLREYIASGRPVVSTAIPECMKYDTIITIAESPAGFVAAIAQALVEPKENSTRRQAAVVNESWRTRAEMLSAAIERVL